MEQKDLLFVGAIAIVLLALGVVMFLSMSRTPEEIAAATAAWEREQQARRQEAKSEYLPADIVTEPIEDVLCADHQTQAACLQRQECYWTGFTRPPCKSLATRPNCTKTDGDDPYTKGSITGIDRERGQYTGAEDWCRTPRDATTSCSGTDCTLAEMICVENFVTERRVSCENGCENGACVREARPDLIIKNITVTVYEHLQDGPAYMLNITVKNNGTVPATESTLYYEISPMQPYGSNNAIGPNQHYMCLSSSGSPSIPYSATENILEPGQESSIQSMLRPVKAGKIRVAAHADYYGNTVKESDETNNRMIKEFTVEQISPLSECPLACENGQCFSDQKNRTLKILKEE